MLSKRSSRDRAANAYDKSIGMHGRSLLRSLSVRSMFLVAVTLSGAGQLPEPAKRAVDFQKDVQPIFEQRCYVCHGAQLQTNGLRLDEGDAALKGGNSGPAIKPGDSASSPLILRTAGASGLKPMPPAG